MSVFRFQDSKRLQVSGQLDRKSNPGFGNCIKDATRGMNATFEALSGSVEHGRAFLDPRLDAEDFFGFEIMQPDVASEIQAVAFRIFTWDNPDFAVVEG